MRAACKRISVFAIAFLGSLLLLPGCVTRQVSVERIGQIAAYHEAMDSALTADRPASDALVVLRRYGLEKSYRKTPDDCLTALWPKALADNRRDALFAVAELCFLRAKELDRSAWRLGDRTRARDNYLAAAVSAYLYLFAEGAGPLPGAFDRRLRLACDIYNFSLGKAFADADGRVSVQSVQRQTPLGKVEVTFDRPELLEAIKTLDDVLLADDYAVRGLEIRNRTSGIGTPVIAVKQREADRPLRQTAGATLLLTCREPNRQENEVLHCTLSAVTSADRQEIEIGHLTVPVEMDQTTPIAYALSDPLLWKLGRRIFRLGQANTRTGIYPMEPYSPGKIPVLFVHGTMSSPFLWADMWNSLRADPEIGRRYQFWFYFYQSSNPVMISGTHLRENITAMVQELDPLGKNPALRQMVVIGHSQGGLLTKLTAVDTGESLVQAMTGNSLAGLNLSAENEAIARRYTVFTPLPEVKRVVFISTPHRGSYQASGLARGLVRRLVAVPTSLTQVGTVLDQIKEHFTMPTEFRRQPTSIDGMSPKNPVLLRLAELPVAPGVHAHSIIPIKGKDVPPEGKDGVVAYASAHLDGVESEYVVRDGHSCQGNPLAIEEVRRILLKHLTPEQGQK